MDTKVAEKLALRIAELELNLAVLQVKLEELQKEKED